MIKHLIIEFIVLFSLMVIAEFIFKTEQVYIAAGYFLGRDYALKGGE